MTKTNSKVKSAILCALVMCLSFAAIGSSGQTKKQHWQAGTLLEVKAHQGEPGNPDAAKEYDVSVKVGAKIYVALYVQESDQADPGFYVGVSRNVLVDGDILKVNDLQGNTRSLRILSRKDAPPPESK